ncbi:hypothetical protein [Nocardia gamkensis]|uniref:ESX-1 secretion-associated protein n=1 Tax=Nocardia gamkensis TaxID=352869 RepID=A0A7X6L4M1_9NOCA|nr:hypothetical protein [Nocardia gamkensis]NKY27559.1 hypothetical protein [Nocardia gamkensis]NQE71741.1 hypothetical protein [Nocardia gamkensis]
MAPRPDARHLKVATDDLRAEANIWAREATSLNDISTKIVDLKFNRVEAGLFQGVVSAHSKVVDRASDRCREGVDAFTEVSATLKKVADTYDYEDRNFADQVKDLW